ALGCAATSPSSAYEAATWVTLRTHARCIDERVMTLTRPATFGPRIRCRDEIARQNRTLVPEHRAVHAVLRRLGIADAATPDDEGVECRPHEHHLLAG